MSEVTLANGLVSSVHLDMRRDRPKEAAYESVSDKLELGLGRCEQTEYEKAANYSNQPLFAWIRDRIELFKGKA